MSAILDNIEYESLEDHVDEQEEEQSNELDQVNEETIGYLCPPFNFKLD